MLNIIQPVNDRWNSDLQANLTLQPHVLNYCLLIQKIEKKKKMLGVKTTQSPFVLIYPLERASLLRYKISLHAVQQNSSYSIILSRFYSSGYRWTREKPCMSLII